VFVSGVAVPVLQLFVEQHDSTTVTSPIFIVPGVQCVEQLYALLDVPEIVAEAVFLFYVYKFEEFMVE
jgi:hypothetical protein